MPFISGTILVERFSSLRIAATLLVVNPPSVTGGMPTERSPGK
jgi:hypothetical protein